LTPERKAFLEVLKNCEGTSLWPDPYLVIFGGRTSPYGYKDHPGNLGFHDWRHFKGQNGKDTYSTASGAYQFLLRTWNRLKVALDLVDFSPDEQDRAAIELIHEKKALVDVDRGEALEAARKCAGTWASLPGAPYGQPTKSPEYVLAKFQEHLAKEKGEA
jgi:lysozyme